MVPLHLIGATLKMMHRILIIGCCGAGKTTLARELGARLGLEPVHLDRLWWRPGWRERGREEFDAELAELLRRPEWILDGNFQRTLPERLKFADTVILLEYPRSRCLWNTFKRYFRYRGTSRPDVGEGCPERLNLPFLRYIWNYNRVTLPRVQAALEAAPAGCRIIRLASPAATAAFLKRFS